LNKSCNCFSQFRLALSIFPQNQSALDQMSSFTRGHRRHRSSTEANPLASITLSLATEPQRSRSLSLSLTSKDCVHATQLRAFSFPRVPTLVEPVTITPTTIVSTPPVVSVNEEPEQATKTAPLLQPVALPKSIQSAVSAESLLSLSSSTTNISLSIGQLVPPVKAFSAYDQMKAERDSRCHTPPPPVNRRDKAATKLNLREEMKKGMLERIETGRRRRFVIKTVLPEYHQQWLETMAQKHCCDVQAVVSCGFNGLVDLIRPLMSPSLIA